MSKRAFNRGLRFGGLLEALCISRQAVQAVGKYRDLLESEDAERVTECLDILTGLEQRAWSAAEEEW